MRYCLAVEFRILHEARGPDQAESRTRIHPVDVALRRRGGGVNHRTHVASTVFVPQADRAAAEIEVVDQVPELDLFKTCLTGVAVRVGAHVVNGERPFVDRGRRLGGRVARDIQTLQAPLQALGPVHVNVEVIGVGVDARDTVQRLGVVTELTDEVDGKGVVRTIGVERLGWRPLRPPIGRTGVAQVEMATVFRVGRLP